MSAGSPGQGKDAAGPGHPDRGAPAPAPDVLNALLERSEDGVFVIGLDDRVEWVNTFAGKMFGVRPSDLIGKPRADLFAPEIASRQAEALKMVFGGATLEARPMTWPGDPPTFLEVALLPVRAQDGSVRAALGICRDITRRLRLEKEVIAQRDLALALMGTTSVIGALEKCLEVALEISDLDAGGGYLVDPATGALDLVCHMGVSKEFAGRVGHMPKDSPEADSIRDCLPVYSELETIPAGSADAMMQEGLRSLAILPVVHDGRPVACLTLASRIHPSVPAAARIIIESVAVQVGTAIFRLGIQEALARSEHLYRTTVDSMDDWIHVIDSAGRIILINESFLALNRGLGLDQNPVGKTVPEVFPFLPDEVQDEYQEVFASGRVHVAENKLEIKGKTVFTRTKKVPVFEGGRVIRVITLVQDITEAMRVRREREEVEARMLQAQKFESLGVLAGGVAHDFNNLLTGIIGNTELAQRESRAGAGVEGRLQKVRSAALRASELTRQLLDCAGKGVREAEAVDINCIVREMSGLIEATIPRRITLSYDLAEDLPEVEADPTQIRQVLINLLLNAAEAIGDAPGEIMVITRADDRGKLISEGAPQEKPPEGRSVLLEVRDSGCGMTPETRERIFDPFFTTKFTGRGLGLASSLGIVRGHGGAIEVESAPDRGASFKIILPSL